MICEQIGEEQETGTVPSVYALGLPIGVSNGAERRLARERESGESKRSKTDAQVRQGREKSANQQLTGTLRS